MSNPFTIGFTDQQMYILQDIAKDHYRTLDNFIGLLIVEGLKSYGFTNEICVKKRQEDRDPDGPEWQHYKDDEITEIFSNLPFSGS